MRSMKMTADQHRSFGEALKRIRRMTGDLRMHIGKKTSEEYRALEAADRALMRLAVYLENALARDYGDEMGMELCQFYFGAPDSSLKENDREVL